MKRRALTELNLKDFTAFAHLDLALSPGINIFIGENGTGKTHILKLLYAACDITRTQEDFQKKLIDVFLPSKRRLGRLARRKVGIHSADVKICREEKSIQLSFSTKDDKFPEIKGRDQWYKDRIECAYIPVKEMLANAPGFHSLYAGREIHFEGVYADIIDRAFRPIIRGPIDKRRKSLLKIIADEIKGTVTTQKEEFFLKTNQGNLEFTLLAEGMRKLALIWQLIQNGTLLEGAILFWDEPEANLNPKMIRSVVEILLELQRIGVQIFLATHDYVILKEFDLQIKPSDSVLFHCLFHEPEKREIRANSVKAFLDIDPNTIAETFSDLYDREVARTLGRSR